MSAEAQQTDRFSATVARLEKLSEFAGPAKAFWASCLSLLAGVAGAQLALLLRPGPKETPGWRKVLSWPGDSAANAHPGAREFLRGAGDVAEACVVQGSARRGWRGADDAPQWCLGVRLAAERESEVWVAVLLLGTASEAAAEEALRRVRLLAHLPRVHGLHQRADRAEVAVGHFASVLELVSSLNEHTHFSAAAMALCNELATRHQCGRVSLGWLEGDYVRLRALSHSEKFDRKTEAAQALEAAMEEALDQDETIVWPEPDGQALVTRDHAKFADAQKAKFLCSLPVRLEGEGVAVLACERDTQPFAEVELRLLTLSADMAARRLADLKAGDRWFGARWAAAAREKSALLLGSQHTGAKLIALGIAALLAWACFGRMTYRIEAPFTLATDHAAFVSAPFNGFIDEVQVEVGSEVKKGEPLATLDSRDLLLEEAAALADQSRYLREAAKSSAVDKVAEMRIAEAQAEQSRARLELVRHHRAQSTLVAPFDSVVVEGDLKKRIGAPVRQGDVLFKVTRLDRMEAECRVPEQEAHELAIGQRGEIAFASSPRERTPVRVTRIDPVAQPKEGGNVLVVRGSLEGERGDWWRPGMSGVAKLDAGTRSPAWIAGHRTVDFLRMKLWW